MALYASGKLVGTMKLDLSSLTRGPDSCTVGYEGVKYESAKEIDEQWDGGKHQSVATNKDTNNAYTGFMSVVVYPDDAGEGTQSKGSIASYQPVPISNIQDDNNVIYQLKLLHIAYYVTGTYKVVQTDSYQHDDRVLSDWKVADDLIEVDEIRDDNKNLTGKIETIYTYANDFFTEYPEDAKEDEYGNKYIEVKVSVDGPEDGAFEENGQWYKYEKDYNIGTTYYYYDVITNTYSPVLQQLKIQSEVLSKSINFYPAPQYLIFQYNTRLYPAKGITSGIPNFFDFYKCASQYLAWRDQKESKCARSTDKYLTAKHLNDVMKQLTADNTYAAFVKNAKIDIYTFAALSEAVNSG